MVGSQDNVAGICNVEMKRSTSNSTKVRMSCIEEGCSELFFSYKTAIIELLGNCKSSEIIDKIKEKRNTETHCFLMTKQ